MANHDPLPSAISWVQVVIATITGIFGALGGWLAMRSKKLETGPAMRQAEVLREQHVLDVAVAQTKSTYADLHEYSERLEGRIDRLEKDRDRMEAENDKLRQERNEAERRIHRLERQVAQLGAEPTNGH